ncbi:hypothetical protein MRX96_045627 [Rhipicephalus microplus]
MRPPEKRPPDRTAPHSQQPYKKALLTNAPAKVAQAPHGDAENLGAKNIHTGTSGDPNTSKRKTFQQLHILMHEYRDDPDLLLMELEHQFNPIGPPPQYPDYPYVGDDSSEVLPSEVTPQLAEPCELSECDLWPRPKVLKFVEEYKTFKNNPKNRMKSNQQMFENVATVLIRHFPGRAVTGSQVENKWRTLKRSYLGTRRKNNTSGHGRHLWASTTPLGEYKS